MSQTYPLPGTDLHLNRVGFGAMQLAGPHVFGPPADHDGALAVLREARALGINHIDTSDFYGPHITNQLIREALHPYPDDLVLVTKVGFKRGRTGAWLISRTPDQITAAVEDNLRNLSLDALHVVNLRMGEGNALSDASLAEPLGTLIDLKAKGLVRHIGLSNITPKQFAEGSAMTDIVCVQNLYNVANRQDDGFLEDLAAAGIPYVPFFPLGGFTPLQSSALDAAAESLDATPMQIALAWLLQRSPNVLLIPGTKSLAHLRENTAAATLELPPLVLNALDGIATTSA